MHHRLTTYNIVLERLANFLPVMRQANADLVEQGDAHLYSIEAADSPDKGSQGQMIEMSFGLGIYGPADDDEHEPVALLPSDDLDVSTALPHRSDLLEAGQGSASSESDSETAPEGDDNDPPTASVGTDAIAAD